MISISGVKKILENNSADLGTLCTDPTIVPWSKWKPIHTPELELTDYLLESLNYGITILNGSNPNQLLLRVQENDNTGFIYNKPDGFYRLGDFRNYDHNAYNPIEAYYIDGYKEKIGDVDSDYKTTFDEFEEGSEPVALEEEDTNLTKSDIYPKTDINGDPIILTRGALVTDGTESQWSVGYIPWGNVYWQRFKGKECIVLEFMTNLSEGTTGITHSGSSTDLFYALPYPLHTIFVSNEAPFGSKDVWIDTTFEGGGIFFTDDTYSKVSYCFRYSSIGDEYSGGYVINPYIALFKDENCTDLIQNKRLNNGETLTLEAEQESDIFSGTLDNTTGLYNIFVAFYWKNEVKFVTMPEEEVKDPELMSQMIVDNTE